MKYTFYTLFLILTTLQASAQQGDEVFSFLRYPVSPRVNALGGYNVSLDEPDPSLIFGNPGLLGAEMDKKVSLSYMNFFSTINMGSALYTKAVNDNGAWAAGVNFISYGTFKQTNAENITEGEFTVEDISLNAIYAHDLSDKWRGGITFKFLYSSLERYTSIGLAADAGLSYYDSERNLSFGLTLNNFGAQIKSYYDKRYPLPWDIQAGFSKRLAHAPFRLSVTAISLNRLKLPFLEHFAAGVDFIPSDNFWLALGYNPKTAHDMKLETGNALGGWSAGAGIRINTFDVGVSLARYHPSALSLLVGISMTY
jgi:hypothetical protein